MGKRFLPRHRDRAWDVLEQMFVLWQEVYLGPQLVKAARQRIWYVPCFPFQLWGDSLNVHYILFELMSEADFFFLVVVHYLKFPIAKVKKNYQILYHTPQTTKEIRIHSQKQNQVQCGFCLHVPLILQRHWFQLQFPKLLGTIGCRSRCEWYRARQRLWFGECFGKAVGMFAFGLHPFLGWRRKTTLRA